MAWKVLIIISFAIGVCHCILREKLYFLPAEHGLAPTAQIIMTLRHIHVHVDQDINL